MKKIFVSVAIADAVLILLILILMGLNNAFKAVYNTGFEDGALDTIKYFATQVIPQCQEDQIILGMGEFNNGYWDHYVCGPSFDDLFPQGDFNNG